MASQRKEDVSDSETEEETTISVPRTPSRGELIYRALLARNAIVEDVFRQRKLTEDALRQWKLRTGAPLKGEELHGSRSNDLG